MGHKSRIRGQHTPFSAAPLAGMNSIAETPITRHLAQISPSEQTAIIEGLAHPEEVQASGVRIAGIKYFTLQAEPTRIYGKQGVRRPMHPLCHLNTLSPL